MDRLPRRDLRSLDEFLRESYAVRNLQAYPHHILSGLPKLVRQEITTYNEFDSRRARVTRSWDSPDTDFPDSKEIFERYIREHPVIAHRVRTNYGQALTLSDFITRKQFHRLALYNEFSCRLGVEYVISIMIPARPSVLIGIPLGRARPDFTERDRLPMNLLQPHLVQAYRNAEAVAQMQEEVSARKRLDEFGREVIVIRQGQVQVMTARAQQWLAEYFGGPSRPADPLPETLRRWMRNQEGDLAGDDDHVASPGKPLTVDQGGEPSRCATGFRPSAEPPPLGGASNDF